MSCLKQCLADVVNVNDIMDLLEVFGGPSDVFDVVVDGVVNVNDVLQIMSLFGAHSAPARVITLTQPKSGSQKGFQWVILGLERVQGVIMDLRGYNGRGAKGSCTVI
jgi:hypothetical protein